MLKATEDNNIQYLHFNYFCNTVVINSNSGRVCSPNGARINIEWVI